MWTVVAAVRQIKHRMAVISSFHSSASPGVTLTVILLFILLCSAVSLASPDVIPLAPQVRFNGHGLGSQFPLIINPEGPCSTGAVIRSLTLTSWVLIHTQTPRHMGGWGGTGDSLIESGRVTFAVFRLGYNVCDEALWRADLGQSMSVRWHDENIDEHVAFVGDWYTMRL